MNPSNSSTNLTGEKLLATATPTLSFPKGFNANALPIPPPSFPPLFVPPPQQPPQFLLQQLFSSNAAPNGPNPSLVNTNSSSLTSANSVPAPSPQMPPLFLPNHFLLMQQGVTPPGLLPLPPHLIPPVLTGPLLNPPPTSAATTNLTNSSANSAKKMEGNTMILESGKKLDFSFGNTPHLHEFFADPTLSSSGMGEVYMDSSAEKVLHDIFETNDSKEHQDYDSKANANSPNQSSADRKLKRGRKAVQNENLIPISDKPYVVVKAPRNVTKRESKTWTDEDDQKLLKAITENPEKYTYEGDINRIKWSHVIEQVLDNKYSTQQAYQRYMRVLHPNLKRDSGWTPEEDEKLIKLTEKYGQKWSEVAREMNFTRADVWCRQRFRKLQAARMNGVVTPSLSQFNKKNLKKKGNGPAAKRAKYNKEEEEASGDPCSSSSSIADKENEDPDFSDLSYDEEEEEENLDKDPTYVDHSYSKQSSSISSNNQSKTISIQNGNTSLQQMLEQKARLIVPEGFPMGTVTFVSMMNMMPKTNSQGNFH